MYNISAFKSSFHLRALELLTEVFHRLRATTNHSQSEQIRPAQQCSYIQQAYLRSSCGQLVSYLRARKLLKEVYPVYELEKTSS